MFDFVDLFAGVGGFHAALASLGGRGVLACEIDPKPAAVYEANWRLKPVPDVRDLGRRPEDVPDHALLAGGFPCQPFSKSGRQLGILEERGTLFQDVLKILEVKRPAVVMLENVRNLAGRNQQDAWNAVTDGLREVGYKVSQAPCVFSPHLLGPDEGGAPQVRDRVYIMGVLVGRARAKTETAEPPVVQKKPQGGWDPSRWSIEEHVLLADPVGAARQKYAVSSDEATWLNTWNELLSRLKRGTRLPGFPLWEKCWSEGAPPDYGVMPPWKRAFVDKNLEFYRNNRVAVDGWLSAHGDALSRFPESRRKLEWQAQDSPLDLWQLLIQLRPSGIRVKRPTWTPALVAMNQTSIYGPRKRRLTPLETARLQGFDHKTFTFGSQADSLSYKQMGNAVNVGAATYVLKRFVEHNAKDIVATGEEGEALVQAVLGAAPSTAEGAA